MKFLKKHKGNLIFFAIFTIIFFTPIGFQLKVLVNRYIHFSPSEIAEEEQISITNYDWNLTDDNGTEVDFNDYKGRVVIVNFWATWCPPCVAELPSFQKLYDSYKSKVVFLFVANDKTEKVERFMTKYNYQFTNYYEISRTPSELQSRSIPATFVISKQGKIAMSKTGATNWNTEKVKNVLDRLLK
jgi:thiol-disulfide isomerase/thioredoxin